MRDTRFPILFLSVFVTTLGISVIAPLIPYYEREMGAGGLAIGMVFAAYALPRIVFTPLIGERSDRRGRRPFITAGLLFYAIISFSYLLAADVGALILVRFLHGLASVLVTPVAMAYAGEISKEGREGRTMATMNVAMFAGAGAGPLLAGFMHSAWGYSSVFYGLGAISLATFLVAYRFLPDSAAAERGSGDFSGLGDLMRQDILKVLLVWGVSAPMGIALVVSFVPVLAGRMGLRAHEVGVAVAVCPFLIALLQRPFGGLADRVDRYRKVFLLFTGQMIISISLLFTPGCRTLGAILCATGIVGLGTAIAYPVAADMTVLIGRRTGMGRCVGLVNASRAAGTAITPLVAGLVMAIFGLKAVFYVVGVMILACKLTCYYYTSRWLETGHGGP